MLIKDKAFHLRRNIKNFLKIHYSRDGEDLLLIKYAKKRKGFYVDVGCSHPFVNNNTFKLYKMGWSGICIDPLPRATKLFRWYRPRDKVVTTGISLSRSELNYYEFNNFSYNTCDPEKADEVVRKGKDTVQKVSRIPCQPLAEIMDAYCAGKDIDVLDVDTEGLDLSVLQSNNWQKYRPRVILVEDSDFSPLDPHRSEIVDFLINKGYELRAFTGLTLLFTRNRTSFTE